MYSKGLSIFRSFNIQCSVFFLSDTVCQIRVICCRVRISHTLPAVCYVFCIQFFTVRPFQTIFHGESIGQTIFAQFISFCQIRNQFTVLIVHIQTSERQDCQAGTIYRRVQSRIQFVRFRSNLQSQLVIRCSCVCKIFESKQVCIDSVYICVLHIGIIVVIQRGNCPCIHQHILCLMHHSLTFCKVCLCSDCINQGIILFPCRCCFAGWSVSFSFACCLSVICSSFVCCFCFSSFIFLCTVIFAAGTASCKRAQNHSRCKQCCY